MLCWESRPLFFWSRNLGRLLKGLEREVLWPEPLDVLQLLVELVEVAFPAYIDGRGYSAAAFLRERGYTGELRAVGDVLIDQLSHYHRVGFDAFLPDQPISREAVDKAIATWPYVYQRTVDGRTPIWALRHG